MGSVMVVVVVMLAVVVVEVVMMAAVLVQMSICPQPPHVAKETAAAALSGHPCKMPSASHLC